MTQIIDSHAVERATDTDYLTDTEVAAERGALAAMLAGPRWCRTVTDRIGDTMLVHHRHRTLYAAIQHAHSRGEIPGEGGSMSGVPGVHACLERAGQATPDVINTLYGLPDAQPLADGQLEQDLERLAVGHARRTAMSAGHRLRRIGDAAADWDLEGIRDAAETAIVDLAEATTARTSEPESAADDWDEFLDGVENNPRNIVRTGYIDLDRLIRIRRGGYAVIAARTSIGKSAFGLNLASRMAAGNDNVQVTYLSYEMSRHECRERLASAAARIPGDRIQEADLTEQEWQRLRDASAKMPRNLLLPSAPQRRLAAALSTIYRAAVHDGPAVVFVDYAQQLKADRQYSNSKDELKSVSNALQEAAQETGVTVIALAQLNRESEHRADKRPQMSDVYGCDNFAQDANNVVLLHRPDHYEQNCLRQGQMDLLIDKNRGGRTGTVTLAHRLQYSRITDLAREQ